MATTVTLLSTNQLGNPPGAAQIVPAATRGRLSFSITGPLTNYAQATVLASLDGAIFDPVAVINILPGGPNTVTWERAIQAPFTVWDANLDNMTPGQGITATLTLTV